MIWLEFFFCGALIVSASHSLCRRGIRLARGAGIDESVIGMLFLAVATSFPEVSVGISSVLCTGDFSLGYGALVGSVMINCMLVAVIDAFNFRHRVLGGISRENMKTISFMLTASVLLLLAMIARGRMGLLNTGRIGVESFLIVGLYAVYLCTFRRSKTAFDGILPGDVAKRPGISWKGFFILLFAVSALGFWMSHIGERLASASDLSRTFVGASFLALVTSFPEITVGLSALRAGSSGMAIGNVLGSNLFDICIVPVLDVFTPSPIFAGISTGQLAASGVIVLISLVFLLATHSRRSFVLPRFLDSGSIFVLGVSGLLILYFVK